MSVTVIAIPRHPDETHDSVTHDDAVSWDFGTSGALHLFDTAGSPVAVYAAGEWRTARKTTPPAPATGDVLPAAPASDPTPADDAAPTTDTPEA